MKIAVVDDDAFTLSLLGRQLAQLGQETARLIDNPVEAVRLLESDGHEVDLLLCDLQMPAMDGIEFVRHLARVGWQGSLVLISGEEARVLQTAQRLAAAHGIHLLGTAAKPVTLAQLQAFINQHATRHDPAPPGARRSWQPEELRDAIDRGELVNHYQPKVSLTTGDVVGVESLVRWQHPTAGLVYPDTFIGITEEHGLIDDLTRAVLGQALRDLRGWHDAGLAIQVAVNVSMDNLASLDFPDRVAMAAAAAGVAPTSVILEVTESRLMKGMLTPLDILTRLRLKRIGLAIDDFGTGHSSLAQLRDLPFNELKLDRGFVNGAVRDPSLAAIVEGTLSMARSLGITSVAEGVEDQDDWNFMRQRGCDIAQGYFIARPMPAAQVLAWTQAWRQRPPG